MQDDGECRRRNGASDEDRAPQGGDDRVLPGGRADRVSAAAGAGRLLGALVRPVQAARAGARESGRRRERQGDAGQDEHRRPPADRRPTRHPVDSRPSSPSARASRSTASSAPCRKARFAASSSAWSGPLEGGSAALLAEAEEAAAKGDAAGAAEIYAEILAAEPGEPKAIAALPASGRGGTARSGQSACWRPRLRPRPAGNRIRRSRRPGPRCASRSRPRMSANSLRWNRRSRPIPTTTRLGSIWRWRCRRRATATPRRTSCLRSSGATASGTTRLRASSCCSFSKHGA